ncbi:uncharacterized protein BCR38DRAFT_168878 [Pseudomassariella vexata]|uniref:Uncharacterized protein n=1 Tax=Pseudomassariella vexata TaxID=1141098 RepID=A0A1Y2E2Z6_9PEZI|nr:uncharacterized protein BCR38DRAFT_168878 [Pseudomassariella vexata]ORY65918.1 hypothetical protein BCR38DRAFT_168878 [Pseudomassariella vexata]
MACLDNKFGISMSRSVPLNRDGNLLAVWLLIFFRLSSLPSVLCGGAAAQRGVWTACVNFSISHSCLDFSNTKHHATDSPCLGIAASHGIGCHRRNHPPPQDPISPAIYILRLAQWQQRTYHFRLSCVDQRYGSLALSRPPSHDIAATAAQNDKATGSNDFTFTVILASLVNAWESGHAQMFVPMFETVDLNGTNEVQFPAPFLLSAQASTADLDLFNTRPVFDSHTTYYCIC